MKVNTPSRFLCMRVKPNLGRKPKKEGLKQVASLGPMCIVDSALAVPTLVPIVPDPDAPENQVVAMVHRAGREMADPDPAEAQLFKRYAQTFIRTHFEPLTKDEIPTFKEWLDKTSYNPSRKQGLTDQRKLMIMISEAIVYSESFIKDESYQEGKNSRGINSYTDPTKTIIGPIQHAIDKKTFKSKWFVKGTAPRTWPRKLREAFGTSPVMETDFSSFEAHHHGINAEVVHYWIMHMIRDCGLDNHFKRLVSRMMLGTNVTKFKSVTATIPQRLMSGAMWTSSANGVLNLLFMSYINGRTMFPHATPEWLATNVDEFFVGFVEGDDGICRDNAVDESVIARLGIDLKFETAPHYGAASFCGIVCDPEDDRIVTDPKKVLRSFFSVPRKYMSSGDGVKMGLFRAKALSGKCNFNHAPIVGELYHHVCKKTQHVKGDTSETIDSRHREFAVLAKSEGLHLVRPEVTLSSRILVERRFGIPIYLQCRLEEQIRSADRVLALDLQGVVNAFDVQYASRFCTQAEHCPSPFQLIPPIVQEYLDNRHVGRPEDWPRRVKQADARFALSPCEQVPTLDI